MERFFSESEIQKSKDMYLNKDINIYDREHPFFTDICYQYDYKGDKDTLAKMKELFPEASKTEQVLPWILGWTGTWEFQSVYLYDAGGTRLCWLCKDSDNRLLGIAYADYNVDKHAFDDLNIILSKHANDTDRK
jgi:hypothetical protein